ncbi:MarR family winged helix-turn-helix transcriptional regulator [Amycolatopsis granulosa]|uniref:MarR family winged helix-turn-helix transcriptional regulator n=1 Tax=Amycolatopsis granulosa TaxID=185684 RepID=UPI00141E910A|nr:MarR family transcriptional regulator [Amycolatopsis granulosa]NIH84749.1 DNA-binding MarR family transcriptional regulator [Amycolatopsis granulosa]
MTRWLDESEQQAWRAYVTMQGHLNAALGRRMQADSKLSLPDFEVLVQLTETREGRVRVFELARALDWEKSRLSHHLRRMQKRGLVAREECPDDARGAFIAVTREGREAIEQAAPHHVDTVRELVFDALTPDQVDALRAISERILAAVRPQDWPQDRK